MKLQVICSILVICAVCQIYAAPSKPKSAKDLLNEFAEWKIKIAENLEKKLKDETITEKDVKDALSQMRQIGQSKIDLANAVLKELDDSKSKDEIKELQNLIDTTIEKLSKLAENLEKKKD